MLPVARGSREEALAIMIEYHGALDSNSEIVRFELAEIEAAIEVENMQKSASWMALIESKGNRHRTFLVCVIGFMMQWQGNGLVSYYLKLVLSSVGITNSKTQLEINGGTQICTFVSALISAQFIEIGGRRRMFLISLAGTALSYIIWTILSARAAETNYANKGLSYGVVAMIFVFQAVYHVSGPVAPVYVQECSKYELRSKANTVYQFSSTAASVFNSFANPIALDALNWKYYIVVLLLGCHLVCGYFLLVSRDKGP